MRRHVIEFQRLDIGERAGGLKPRNVRNGRARADVEEDLIARQHARPAIIEAHLERFGSHETPGPHDELGAAVFVVAHVRRNLGVDHVTLALANRHHVDRHATRLGAKLRGVARRVCDVRAPDLVLARHAIDIGAGAADPLPLHDGRASPRLRHVPRQELAASSTAKDQDFKPFV